MQIEAGVDHATDARQHFKGLEYLEEFGIPFPAYRLGPEGEISRMNRSYQIALRERRAVAGNTHVRREYAIVTLHVAGHIVFEDAWCEGHPEVPVLDRRVEPLHVSQITRVCED